MSPKEKLECELEQLKNMPRHDTVSSGPFIQPYSAVHRTDVFKEVSGTTIVS